MQNYCLYYNHGISMKYNIHRQIQISYQRLIRKPRTNSMANTILMNESKVIKKHTGLNRKRSRLAIVLNTIITSDVKSMSIRHGLERFGISFDSNKFQLFSGPVSVIKE